MFGTIGILTGGGDAPGLNAVIRAVVKTATCEYGMRVIGIEDGFEGLLGASKTRSLNASDVRGLLPRGGTILGTRNRGCFVERDKDGARMSVESVYQEAIANMKILGIDALLVLGGEGTLTIANEFHKRGVPICGVPKTIDNDLACTELTFGFVTALDIATEALDRLHTTAESHDRVMILEVMGRHAGWIALHSGIAGGADVILIPEQPVTVEEACALLEQRHQTGKDFSIVVVSEGYELTYSSGERTLVAGEARATDQFGHVVLGGVGDALGREIENRTGFETRVTVLGHVQRGGTPTPRDRVLATRYGLKAADLVQEGHFGRMAALQGDAIVDVSLEEAVRELKTVPPEWYAVAQAFAG